MRAYSRHRKYNKHNALPLYLYTIFYCEWYSNVFFLHNLFLTLTITSTLRCFSWLDTMFLWLQIQHVSCNIFHIFPNFHLTYLVYLVNCHWNQLEFETKFCEFEQCLVAQHEFVITSSLGVSEVEDVNVMWWEKRHVQFSLSDS